LINNPNNNNGLTPTKEKSKSHKLLIESNKGQAQLLSMDYS